MKHDRWPLVWGGGGEIVPSYTCLICFLPTENISDWQAACDWRSVLSTELLTDLHFLWNRFYFSLQFQLGGKKIPCSENLVYDVTQNCTVRFFPQLPKFEQNILLLVCFGLIQMFPYCVSYLLKYFKINKILRCI